MKILVQNGRYSIISQFRIDEQLENKVYEIDWDAQGNCFLSETGDLTIDTPLYDVNKVFRERILKSFRASDKNMGVLLKGLKGSGKSVDSKLICKHGEMPVVLISKKVPKGINFQPFLNSIEQDYVLFIDEFEKNFEKYDDNESDFHSQLSFLSFMDGLSTGSKKLILLTSNEEVTDLLNNRPSRVRYRKDYDVINEELVKMIIGDMLINQEYAQDIIDNLDKEGCSIDVLKSIISEINILDIPYSEFKDDFNYQPEIKTYSVYFRKVGDVDFTLAAKEFMDKRNMLRTQSYIQGLSITELTHSKINAYVESLDDGYFAADAYSNKEKGSYDILLKETNFVNKFTI